MKAIFIAGTDTGVGKTVVTGLLARYFIENGYSVITQKWIQTGAKGYSQDIYTHLKLMGRDKRGFKKYFSSMMPYLLKTAASPHLSSRLEKKSIKINKIRNSIKRLSRNFDIVLIEGSGGLLVPLGGKRLLIDVVRKLRLPVLLVAANRLGAINHTLLSIEALKRRNIRIIGIIFNNVSKDEKRIILKDNARIVKKLTGIKILGVLPCLKKIQL